MVKKNSNFKFKSAAKKIEKKPRKMKSSFIPYDESTIFKNEDNTDDLVRTYLRDSVGFRGGSGSYYSEDDINPMW